MALILLVDDVAALAEQYAYDLRRIGGFEVRIAGSGQAGLDILSREPVDCMILDLEMPEMDGFEVLRQIRKEEIAVPVIVYTGTGSYDRCVQAVQLGALGFVDKAEAMPSVVREIQNALELTRLSSEVDSLRAATDRGSSLIGSSTPMMKLKAHMARVAPVPSTVLIVGESGSGKELVAREIHRLADDDSRRPFIAINAGALPENLVESEMFGHERGAFSGANRLHKGAFERASGGTLFLDEIGELPASAQAKLLRVLENRELTRVGGERTVRVKARIVAATHRDLAADTETGRFRNDLLFRLNTHVLRIPPLRERVSDIPEIGRVLLAGICRDFGIRPKRFDPDVLDALMQHPWSRNNVRELRNAIERMVIASNSTVIGLEELPPGLKEAASTPRRGLTFAEQKTEAERSIVIRALEEGEWQVSRTAEALGLADHASLLKIMRRLGVSRP
jgi:two-component system, NtrC family, nitrogen regulation response regulator NtrX